MRRFRNDNLNAGMANGEQNIQKYYDFWSSVSLFGMSPLICRNEEDEREKIH